MKYFFIYIMVIMSSYFVFLPLFAVNNETNTNTESTSFQNVKSESKPTGPPQPIIPPQPAVSAKPAVPSKTIKSTANSNDNTFFAKNTHFIISEFEFPDNHELYIKIWKNGKEMEKYYAFEKKTGIKIGNETIRFPNVRALCRIKYGKREDLKPFAIDLNKKGNGETDLPGCRIKRSNFPKNSLIIELPHTTPKFNM